jgi:putative transposase
MMIKSAWGDVIETCWLAIPTHFPKVQLDAFVVMPNHLHGIVILTDDVSRDTIYRVPTPRQFGQGIAQSLATVIGSFKAAVTRNIRKTDKQIDKMLVWQRNYYEHIIRNQQSLEAIQAYIAANPEMWQDDSLFLDDTDTE